MRRALRLWLGLLAALLISCAALGGSAAAGPLARARELGDAERRWAQRPFSRYSMIVDEHRCAQLVGVEHERVVSVEPLQRCSRDPRSITQLFALVHRDGAKGASCIAQGCACDDQISVRASYDAELGYPREIYIRIAPAPNWRHPDYWAYLAAHLRPPSCDYMAGDKIVAVRELTPLP